MKQITTLALAILLAWSPLCAQSGTAKKADSKYENYAYMEAIDRYKKLVEMGYSDSAIFKKLGNANYYNAKYVEAAKWYSKLMEIGQKDLDPDYAYRFAQSLKSIPDYEASNMWMDKFVAMRPDDNRSKLYGQAGDYLATIKENADRYVVRSLSFNSKASDFAPSFYGDELVFTSARGANTEIATVHTWNESPFLDIYIARKKNKGNERISGFSPKINSRAHESSAVFSKEGDTVYFCRNNDVDGSFTRDAQGVSRLKLYRATLEKGVWSQAVELPFNSDAYSIANPALGPEGKKLYFASDMPGTLGLSDIWEVAILEDGTYGKPRNLGPKVNTEARESFPFVTDSRVLYFSSDGHPGLGGLDVYATTLLNDQNAMAVNVGSPINSTVDDFSFIINETTREGYFASNRQGGMGNDDIYGFRELIHMNFHFENTFTVTVKDPESLQPLSAAISIVDDKGELLGYTSTNALGEVELTMVYDQGQLSFLDPGENGTKGIIPTTDALAVLKEPLNDGANGAGENKTGRPILVDVADTHPKPAPDTGTPIRVAPIYFGLNKANIQENGNNSIQQIMQYLRANPAAIVHIESHTDSRASHAYNQKLSEKRAEATKKYFMAQGVAAWRIVSKGFGETQLTNECDDHTPCPEQKHQMNRRSEFQLQNSRMANTTFED